MVLICFFRFLLVFVRPLAVRTSQSLEASPTTVTLGSVTYYRTRTVAHKKCLYSSPPDCKSGGTDIGLLQPHSTFFPDFPVVQVIVTRFVE